MPEVLRLGFAGLGEAATRVLPEIKDIPFIKITAAADLRRSALERFQQEFNAEVYDSVEGMCQSPRVDAVYVATPHEFHAPHTIIALENHKHVIVEKPMALSIEDCEKMNAAAEKYGVKLLCGHTHSFDPPIRKMREIVRRGEIGKVCMIHTWNYKAFMVDPYPDHELAVSRGVVLNQGPHQVDIVRLLGGGMVRSVRAMAGRWDASRPGEGAYACYLEFESGVPATLVFGGYGFFDSAELCWWIGEGGLPREPDRHLWAWRNYKRLAGAERDKVFGEIKEQLRYGGDMRVKGDAGHGWDVVRGHRAARTERHQPFFGLTIVNCEKGDMRQSLDGIQIYGEGEKREVSVSGTSGGRTAELAELYDAVVNKRPVFHDGRWGQATLEVCLAILKSGEERREIYMAHQVPVAD